MEPNGVPGSAVHPGSSQMVVRADWYTVASQRGSLVLSVRLVIFRLIGTQMSDTSGIFVNCIITHSLVVTPEFYLVIDDDGAISTLM